MALTDVEEAVEQAAEAVATLPFQDWPGWITYLMIALEEEHPPEAVTRENLEAVQAAIEDRLREGHW